MNPHSTQMRQTARDLLAGVPICDVRIADLRAEVTDKLERMREIVDEREYRIREAAELRRAANRIEADEKRYGRKSA